jgi:cytochrome oxidase Cu insertion factor (SCO1/SenC/PrrC family)
VTEHDFVILDPTNLTNNERANKQCNTMALNTFYNGIDSKVFEYVKDLERASEVWIRLEETYEGTTTVKSAKLYMLKDKLSNFKMKDDESIPEIFYRLQVIVNDLKSLGEKVKDEDFSHKFLMCLPKKFKTLRIIIFRGGLIGVSPNEILGDIMTNAQYNESDNEDEEKKEKKDKKEKSVAFKASSSSYKGKSKKETSSEDDDDIDDEAMALLVRKMGKFMKKRDYGQEREEIT